ncbi:MAG: FAD-dependent oxidoreductase [Rhizobiales bacterium]|nr:FAD-dependent oxidoreductase [Hyphomicrobiales bacterium]
MKFDIAVIGAGSAGLSVAAAAAQFGQTVVLFEKDTMGGDCLNTGCVPSKALLAAASAAEGHRSSDAFGIAGHEPGVDFTAVMAHVQRVIAAIAPHDSVERFESLGVTVVRAAAKFIAPQTLEAGGEIYEARRIVVATGSRPAVPPVPGLEAVPFFTNETIFRNTTLPSHLIIIGGGPIGLEMAQAHRRLGAQVTVLEAAEPLGRDDPELAAIVLDALRKEGVTIRAQAKIEQVDKTAGGVRLTLAGDERIVGSHLLVAAGRQPNIEGLNLEAAGIAHTAKGITVDSLLRSSNRNVYAAGDVAGGPQFTHVAGYHAGNIIRHVLFRLRARTRYDALPWVTYTDPELAHVGLTEAQARERHGRRVTVLRHEFAQNDRAQTSRHARGMVKIVTGRGGRILGASIVGQQAGEQIALWALAIAQGLGVSAVAGTVLPYPTLAEAGKRAAISYYAALPKRRLTRALIAMLKWFG